MLEFDKVQIVPKYIITKIVIIFTLNHALLVWYRINLLKILAVVHFDQLSRGTLLDKRFDENLKLSVREIVFGERPNFRKDVKEYYFLRFSVDHRHKPKATAFAHIPALAGNPYFEEAPITIVMQDCIIDND